MECRWLPVLSCPAAALPRAAVSPPVAGAPRAGTAAAAEAVYAADPDPVLEHLLRKARSPEVRQGLGRLVGGGCTDIAAKQRCAGVDGLGTGMLVGSLPG